MSKQKNKIHVQEESPFLQAMVEATRAKFGDEGGVTYMGSEINELVVGIPLPALSLMYLFDSDVFPLGKTVGFAGAPQAQKSSLLFEIIRWFQGLGGYGKIVECEGNKVSPTLIASIVGQARFQQVMIDPCRTIDEARKRIVPQAAGAGCQAAPRSRFQPARRTRSCSTSSVAYWRYASATIRARTPRAILSRADWLTPLPPHTLDA